MNVLRYLMLSLAAALGGSMLGSIALSFTAGGLAAAPLIFLVSLPFTIAGGALLTIVGYFFREGLTDDISDYFPIFIVAVVAGPLMTLMLGADVELAVTGAVFALLTAMVWTIMYRTSFTTADEVIDDA